jgi:elongator complex protein 6
MLMDLREVWIFSDLLERYRWKNWAKISQYVHATVLTLSDDSPLALRQHTPLEINHAAFLLNVAHQADLIMSLRLLDTGTARDVSGVIRIAAGRELEKDKAGLNLEGKELLYFVGGDGNVKVFERGQ